MTRADLLTFSGGAPGLLSLLCWGEARGEPVEGQIAVMNVVRNRVDAKTWYGSGWIDVMLKPKQFSCLDDTDPNLPLILDMADRWTPLTAEQKQPLRQLLYLAKGIVDRDILDNTHWATHYYATMIQTPKWAEGKEPTVVIGHHKFYVL